MTEEMANNLYKTVLYERHVALEAKMVEFAGWQMALHYPAFWILLLILAPEEQDAHRSQSTACKFT